MRNKIKYMLLTLCALVAFSLPGHSDSYKPGKPVEKISKGMSGVEKDVRKAAVRILTLGGGHGSGSVIQYKDLQLILTAKHVTEDEIGTEYLIEKDRSIKTAVLIYKNPSQDMAVLLLKEPFSKSVLEPMPWKISKDHKVGTKIVYSGYPSWHSLMSFDGRIAGVENAVAAGTQLIINTYGWFGCSGSVIYNTSGQIMGILYGVDVEYYPEIQVQENMIWVAPIKYLPMDRTLKEFCENKAHNYKACR